MLIDFVGLRKSLMSMSHSCLTEFAPGTVPAPALILGLDVFITIYQLITLYIGYLSYPVPDAVSRGFPADPLLPSNQSWATNDLHRAPVKDVLFENEDDEESQLANAGNHRQRGRRLTAGHSASSSHASRNEVRGEEEDDLYSEFDDLLQRTGTQQHRFLVRSFSDTLISLTDPDGDVLRSTQNHMRTRHPDDPYTVVNMPLLHMLRTILTYPRPSSVSSVEPAALTATSISFEPSNPSTARDRSEQPTVPLSTITDLQLQALAQLHPGLLHASGREATSATEGEDEDDGRSEYRRMPGGYTRPSTS